MNIKSKVYDYIINNWDSCKRFETEDKEDFIGLPYEYIVPTANGIFQEMFYWDTYFACEGLILSERTGLAKSCADNMAFLIDKYGFVPNGNRKPFLNRSQPPYFCMLVKAVFQETKDKKWLNELYPLIEKEYNFWQTGRMSPVGLNHYGATGIDEKSGNEIYEYIIKRFSPEVFEGKYRNRIELAENIIAECESGWDFNPRFDFMCSNYIPVDLNSNLYIYEKTMAYFSNLLQNGRESEWERKAEKRRELMNKYLWNGQCFNDFDYKNDKLSSLFSAAVLHPLWAGIADEEQAKSIYEGLSKIELEYGVAACEEIELSVNRQWAYPNAWAPLQFITVFGLDKYGYKSAAERIARKYVSSIENIFETTGNLWEKYNAKDATINVINEYEMPPMLGWTAGVYLACINYIMKNTENNYDCKN